jgi:oxygen-independent coproporphyrinogen-3 oxidase
LTAERVGRHLDPPRSLYLHIPFCSRRCPYCDFAVQVGAGEFQEPYVEALLAEVRWLAQAGLAPRPLRTVYLGGGTPSLLRPALLEKVLTGVVDGFGLEPDAEVTLEANPEGVSTELARTWRSFGVNRISLGVQSLDDPTLRWLGRSHDAAQAELAIRSVAKAEFSNLSCDLIYAIPVQSSAAFERGLRTVLQYQPQHLSCYELTVEPGTLLSRRVAAGKTRAPAVDDFLEQRRLAVDLLARAGLQRYEVSNYAIPGRVSRHNLSYWTGQPYLAAGCGAHGFLGAAEAAKLGLGGTGLALRYWHLRNATTYSRSVAQGKLGVRRHEWLGRRELRLEKLACGLRLADGVDLDTAPQLQVAAELERLGLLELTGRRARATSRGVDLLDRLTLELAAA